MGRRVDGEPGPRPDPEALTVPEVGAFSRKEAKKTRADDPQPVHDVSHGSPSRRLSPFMEGSRKGCHFPVRHPMGRLIGSLAVEPDGQSAYLLRMPILVIQHSNTSSAATIGEALVRHGLRCRTIRLAAGEPLPSDLDGIDGIISMGSSDSATDDGLPWIAQEIALLKAACAAQRPVLGVCLGAQLLARALGGRVSKMTDNASVGLCRIDLTTAGRDDPLFRGLPWYGSWPSWHIDEISELPPDARLLAKSEECGIEAFAHGIFAYGVQFHPESCGSADGWMILENFLVTANSMFGQSVEMPLLGREG